MSTLRHRRSSEIVLDGNGNWLIQLEEVDDERLVLLVTCEVSVVFLLLVVPAARTEPLSRWNGREDRLHTIQMKSLITVVADHNGLLVLSLPTHITY